MFKGFLCQRMVLMLAGCLGTNAALGCHEFLVYHTGGLSRPSLLLYLPTAEEQARAFAAHPTFSEPELMLSLSGAVKPPGEVLFWYGEEVIQPYGRPYFVGGTWVIDFHSVSVMPQGVRLLWRMPLEKFIQGTGFQFQ